MIFFMFVRGSNISGETGVLKVTNEECIPSSQVSQQSNLVCEPLQGNNLSFQSGSLAQNTQGQSQVISSENPVIKPAEECVEIGGTTSNTPQVVVKESEGKPSEDGSDKKNQIECEMECTIDPSELDKKEECEPTEEKKEDVTKEKEEISKVEVIKENPVPQPQPVQQVPVQSMVQPIPVPQPQPMQFTQGYLITPEQQMAQVRLAFAQLQAELQQTQQKMLEQQRQQLAQQQQDFMQRYVQQQIKNQLETYQKINQAQQQQEEAKRKNEEIQREHQAQQAQQMTQIKEAMQVKTYPLMCKVVGDDTGSSSGSNPPGYKCYSEPQDIIQALIGLGYQPDANGRIVATGCRGDEKVDLIYDTNDNSNREPLEKVEPSNQGVPIK